MFDKIYNDGEMFCQWSHVIKFSFLLSIIQLVYVHLGFLYKLLSVYRVYVNDMQIKCLQIFYTPLNVYLQMSEGTECFSPM